VNLFQEQVGADDGLLAEMVDNGSIVSNPHQGGSILYFNIGRQPVD
jgi:hypothetical protein